MTQAGQRGPQRARRLSASAVARATLGLGVACAALASVWWAEVAIERVRYPYQLDYGEGVVLDNVRQLARGGPLYYDFGRLPCNPLVYGPVYPGLWRLVYGLAPGQFWPGRALAALAAVGSALCIAFAVRAGTGRWAPGLLGAGFYLSLYVTHWWAALARVDAPAALLALAGWSLFVYSRRGRWAGTALMLAAVYTRQSMVAAPLAAVGAVVMAGERRSGLVHLGALLIGGLVALVGLQAWTGGAFWLDAVTAMRQAWRPAQVAELFGGLAIAAPGAWGAGIVAVGLARRDGRLRPVALYLLVAAALMVTAGKVGASANYALEVCAVASVALGMLVGLVGKDGEDGVPLGAVLVAVAVLQMAMTAGLRMGPERHLRDDAALASAVAAEPGEVLSEWMGPVVQAGKTLWVEPFVTTQMALAGRWDQRPLLAMIRGRRFGLVVMSDVEWRRPPGEQVYGRWTEEERASVAQNYTPVGRAGEYWLLRPRTATPASEGRPAAAGRPGS